MHTLTTTRFLHTHVHTYTGIVSKSARGLYLLDADLKREFRREGVNPTAWIWPDRMSVYRKFFSIYSLQR